MLMEVIRLKVRTPCINPASISIQLLNRNRSWINTWSSYIFLEYTAPLYFRFTLWRPLLFTSGSDASEGFKFGINNFYLLYIFIYWKQTIAMFNRIRQKLSGHEYKKYCLRFLNV